MCIFYIVQNTFPTFGQVSWKTNKSINEQINDMIEKLGDNFNFVMTRYFEDFKKVSKEISMIPMSLVEQHAKDVYFLVDKNFTYV